jgi:hypothetical protein
MLRHTQEISSQDKTMMLTAVRERLLPSGPDSDDVLIDSPRPGQRPRWSPRPRSVWAEEVVTAVAANRVRMRAIRSRTERPIPAAEADALHDGIESLLSRADRAARGVDPGYTPFLSWWRGDCIEAPFTTCTGLVFWVAAHPGAVPLCFTTANVTSCPTGQGQASSGDIQVVALLGLLGGTLAAVSIRNTNGISTPYNMAIALALLKPRRGP